MANAATIGQCFRLRCLLRAWVIASLWMAHHAAAFTVTHLPSVVVQKQRGCHPDCFRRRKVTSRQSPGRQQSVLSSNPANFDADRLRNLLRIEITNDMLQSVELPRGASSVAFPFAQDEATDDAGLHPDDIPGGDDNDARSLQQSRRRQCLQIMLTRWTTILQPYLGNNTWVASSTIPSAGLGLFAARSFQAGEIITCYPGDGLLLDTHPTDASDDDEYGDSKRGDDGNEGGTVGTQEGSSSVDDNSDVDFDFDYDDASIDLDSIEWDGTIDDASREVLWTPRVFGSDGAIPIQAQRMQIEDFSLSVCDDYSIVALPSLGAMETPVESDEKLHEDSCYAGHFANDGTSLQANGGSVSSYVIASNDAANAMHTNIDDRHMATIATCSIDVGEEVFVTYGPDYWLDYNARNDIATDTGVSMEMEWDDQTDGDGARCVGKGFGFR
eukprot:CAMPEP_0198130220 /NCGR_PEP_ID=MMETSP1442-20131203/53446_1 /TAXON_ID= /ORGANISM="Craspedostauros australis, Strain CCMP3328" /LENGTH=441 /DNA_ID=CAMNT_0043790783 /DNA_START=20 /DNA_END=1345 /DNA_ORIENTATION=-